MLCCFGKQASQPFLHPDRWQALSLASKQGMSHDSSLFRFSLPHNDQLLGLPLGQHVSLKLKLRDGTEVMRCDTCTILAPETCI